MSDPATTALYRGLDGAALEREYNARASVPSFDAEFARYVSDSARVRRDFPRSPDIVYDATSGETLDLYPAAAGAPVFVWLHGGYWRLGSTADNAFVVPGLAAHGFAVAVVNYTLAPAATLDEIARQVRSAIGFLHRNRATYGLAPRPLVVGGSSAGGQLVGMILESGWQQAAGVPEDVVDVALALSGLYELEPLRHMSVDGWLRLDDAAIERNSPIRHVPARSGARLIAAVGGQETTEFRRQTADYVAAWVAAGHAAETVDMPRHNHFDLALSLREPEGPLVRAVVAAVRARS